MRKIASLLTVLMLLCAFAFAQTRSVTGQIRNDKGETVPFATVVETGNTKNATKADADGFFAIKIKDGSTITITAAGHEAKTLAPGSGVMNVVLVSTGEMKEVVITTQLGIKRRPKEVGYANTTVTNQQLSVGKSPNIGAALSGKVAGLTIYNTNQSVNSSPRIVLRGNRSITGENQALIVLDGVPVPSNTISYLNPNDIESVTVLKGGQAATLYGSDGANGALVITTKKGTNVKPQISVTTSVNVDQIAYLPKFQKEFGSGSGYGFTWFDNFRPFENQQYGDPYDGSIRAAGRKSPDGKWLELPYQFIPNIRNKIWDVGVTTQNDVSISGGDANSTYYLSVSNGNVHGVVPKDEYHRNSVRFNSSKTYGRFKASFDGTYTVDHSERTNADFYFFALNTPGWIPLDKLKDWRNNYFANPNGYFNDYYNNPWFELDNNRNDGRNNYFNGNLSLSFKPLNWMDISYRIGTAVTNSSAKSWANRFDYSDYAKGLLADKPVTEDPQYNDYSYRWGARNSPITGNVGDAMSYGMRINSDLLVTLSKNFKDFSTKLILGNSLQQRTSKAISVSSANVIIPDLFNVSNRSGEPGAGESNSTIHKAGNFADLTVGYKDYLFVHGALRVDQSSVFYFHGKDVQGNDSTRAMDLYTYPWFGGDVSLILTEAVPSIKSDMLNYLKLRAGWNRNGNDNLGAYSLVPTFSPGGGFPYGSTVGVTVNNNFPDPLLKPEFFYTTEAGFEAALWKSRINIDFSWYKTKANNQVLSQQISSTTGYTVVTLNAAKVDNNGIEAEVRGNVYKNKNWTVDLNANYSWNQNKVVGLAGGLERIQLNAGGNGSFIYAQVGQPFPYLATTHFQYDSATGKTIIDPTNGWPLLATGPINLAQPSLSSLKGQGSTTPKHDLGVGARVSYKMFTLAANAEYRSGYVVYSALGNTMGFTGSSAKTTLYHRQPFVWPNSVYKDVSTGKFVDNTAIAVREDIANYLGWGDYGFSNGTLANGEFFTSSGAFWKIRDASLTFNFPQRWVSKLKVLRGASLAVFGRNLYTWLPKDNYWTDPEFSNTTGNGIGINVTGNTPPARQYGATLNVNF
jgi:TonB-linked SusC/RagA family outer membrane protein